MNFLKYYKYHLAALAAIIVMFIASVVLRQENLSAPLTRHDERITAQTLVTCEIWKENGGPAAYQFSPVYTYPGKGNQQRQMLGGIMDARGNVYYISHPPFAFLFAYYGTQFFGGPDTESIRTLSLNIHLLCAIFIYLIATTLLPDQRRNYFSIAGLTGAFLYLFSNGNLWAHGNLYFPDTLVQLFIISGLYFSILLIKGINQNKKILFAVLFLIFFLATYTEWLGLFMSFFVGITFLILWLVKKQRRFLAAFLIVGFASSAALALTFAQYSSIAGRESFHAVFTEKYQEQTPESVEKFPSLSNLENDEVYQSMVGRIDRYYKMAENFVGVFVVILCVVLIIPNARNRIEHAGLSILVLAVLSASVFVHYYVFYPFNSLNDFSSVKTGFVIILIAVICISMIESSFNIRLQVILLLLIGYLSFDKGLQSIEDYEADFPLAEVDWKRIATGETIQKYARPDQAVFVNISSNPELVYTAKHNVFSIKDTSELLPLMNLFDNDHGQYYHHRNFKLEYIQEFEKSNNQLIFTKRMNFDRIETGEGKFHQK